MNLPMTRWNHSVLDWRRLTLGGPRLHDGDRAKTVRRPLPLVASLGPEAVLPAKPNARAGSMGTSAQPETAFFGKNFR